MGIDHSDPLCGGDPIGGNWRNMTAMGCDILTHPDGVKYVYCFGGFNCSTITSGTAHSKRLSRFHIDTNEFVELIPDENDVIQPGYHVKLVCDGEKTKLCDWFES